MKATFISDMSQTAATPQTEAFTTREQRMTAHYPSKLQLYSAATANGIKVAAALEEIKLSRSLKGDDFDFEPHSVRIRYVSSAPMRFISMYDDPNLFLPL